MLCQLSYGIGTYLKGRTQKIQNAPRRVQPASVTIPWTVLELSVRKGDSAWAVNLHTTLRCTVPLTPPSHAFARLLP